jgi:hypothetical protein
MIIESERSVGGYIDFGVIILEMDIGAAFFLRISWRRLRRLRHDFRLVLDKTLGSLSILFRKVLTIRTAALLLPKDRCDCHAIILHAGCSE